MVMVINVEIMLAIFICLLRVFIITCLKLFGQGVVIGIIGHCHRLCEALSSVL